MIKLPDTVSEYSELAAKKFLQTAVFIDDSIYDKVMTLLELFPQDKIKVEETLSEYPAITESEAKSKVLRSINNLDSGSGIPLEEAFSKVLGS